jgi:ADP-ribose pyrophosphatase YjhB (NUDIX family)
MNGLTEAALREPLRAFLSSRAPKRLRGGKPAAVLVPLVERAGEAHLWLLRRPDAMRRHAGQVAFPGGKTDKGDLTPRATALREAEEELGIDAARVDVLGQLDDYVTITGFVMTPILAWLPPDMTMTPNASEVARVFAAPLSTFFGPKSGIFPRRGWTFDGELVWGATAAVIGGLVDVLRATGAAPNQ